jgi:CheY-like chemotaxis protein
VFLYDIPRIHMVLPATDKSGSIIMKKRIKEAILKSNFMHDKRAIIPDLKIGMAIFPYDGITSAGLIQGALENLSKRKTVLIVDDHPQIVRILTMRLESIGYKAECAYNGEDALKSVQRNIPDLLVLDIAMPQMNGYEVYGRLSENPETAHIPVILLTAADVEEGKFEVKTPGNIPIIQKSGGFEHVLSVVNNLL